MKPKLKLLFAGLMVAIGNPGISATIQPVNADPDVSFSQNREAVPSVKLESQQTNGLENVYQHYFALKDALIKGDADQSAQFARELASAMNAVKIDPADAKGNSAFKQHSADIKAAALAIAETQKLAKQRTQFSTLSDHLYALMKVFKPAYPVYLAHCPMFNDGNGANWISKENTIRNPYYGSRMMTCGKVKETLK